LKKEYALAGVDYKKIEPFKRAMQEIGKRTLKFPEKREVFINEESIGTHGVIYEYRGPHHHLWAKTQEGLGNKNWIAEWMYQETSDSKYFNGIGIDTALMAANDVICQGALPVIYTDEVAAGDSEWFMDEKRAKVLAESFYMACKMCGMALPAGESPALRYLVKAERPVKSAPSLSGCVTGIIAPAKRKITGKELRIGDRILIAPSSGLHSNGISLIIKRALTLKEKFLQKLPNGKTLGEESLIPTRSYVNLMEALLENEVNIHAALAITGGGPSKIAFDKRPFTYRIKEWVKVPSIFQFMRELGVSLMDCLTTFNWGGGFCLFLSKEEVNQAKSIGKKAGYKLFEVGIVKKGPRRVIFEPENMVLPPPGE